MIKIVEAEADRVQITSRKDETFAQVVSGVENIIMAVRTLGDIAVFELTEKFDGVRLSSLRVSENEILEAYNSINKDFVDTLEKAKKNIEQFHKEQYKAQLKKAFEIKRETGEVVGQKVMPLNRAGIYVPGGTAAYPSTVLMNAIPAKIAGVKEIVMVTPPDKNGKVNPYILAAARVAGVDKIFKVGGAQAVAALAYGTESIPKVDKITGPGNVFVAEAKRQVFGLVDIDMIAGPSEILVIADQSANPSYVAADMLSQAEHDKNAAAILITTSKELAGKVKVELEIQLDKLPRNEIARASIENNGRIIIAKNLDEAIDLSNEIAPEHLELCVSDPFALLDKVQNAGSVFLGSYTPEAVGDYFAGANHTLPTSGSAKYASALSVDDFMKKTQYVFYTRVALERDAGRISDFARREGLDGHANSVTIRTERL
ncbi:MAG TPA: histidinol dehydrogenase [Clostridia bacterium]|mgnify:CR=1 FL=1|nr:histidinol dehydrogenase [Clostridia bacterium]